MRLRVHREPRLPVLGWVAGLERDRIEVRAGTLVEVGDRWIAEAVWDGAYRQGAFDRTAAVFGSGVRLRGDLARAVSSAGLVDRLWIRVAHEELRVSNSLPALLAVTGDRLRDDVDYRPSQRNVPTGTGPGPVLATEDGKLSVVYRSNLEWDGDELRLVSKPATGNGFPDFPTYRGYLSGAVQRMGANATSDDRDHPMSLLTTVSRGYDSPAVSVLAKDAGCRRAVTIRQARSVVPRDDSGAEIASALGIGCEVVDRGGRGDPDELAFWAADGQAGDQNMAALGYPGEVTALLSGAFGGIIWEERENKHPALADYADRNLLSFCEYRLLNGVIHCPVPYLGYDRADEILAITRSPEMEPWSVGGDYDRPIPRRIVEEAGIPRGSFAGRKSATQFEESFHWPHRKELRSGYSDYLRRIGEPVPPVRWYRLLNELDRDVLLPLQERTPLSSTGLRRRLRRPGRWLLNWANNAMARRLARSGRERCGPSDDRGGS